MKGNNEEWKDAYSYMDIVVISTKYEFPRQDPILL